MISAFSFATDISWERFLSLPLGEIPYSWPSAQRACPVRYRLALTPAFLFLGGEWRREADCHSGSSPGSFIEGLWEHDVLELFSAAPGGKTYVELHLDPRGSWWLCRFSDYRKREKTLPGTVEARSGGGSGIMWSALRIERRHIGEAFFAETAQASISAIHVHGGEKEYYISAAPPPVTPDFHLASLREGIVWNKGTDNL